MDSLYVYRMNLMSYKNISIVDIVLYLSYVYE
jgi:hypothetical protein